MNKYAIPCVVVDQFALCKVASFGRLVGVDWSGRDVGARAL